MQCYRRWILGVAALLGVPGVLAAGEGIPVQRSAPAVSATSQNQMMAEEIAHVLHAQGQLKGCRIAIEYLNGNVTLHGTVSSPAQHRKVVRLTKGVRGVRKVTDQLEVAQPQASAVAPTDNAVHLARGWQAQEAGEQPQPMPQPGIEEAVPMAPAPVSPAMASYAPPSPTPVRYDLPHFPPYAWPSYAAYPNYAAVTYPKQYSPTAWPYIGPFYPYPQVPLGWRKVTLQWDDGWWFLDFKD